MEPSETPDCAKLAVLDASCGGVGSRMGECGGGATAVMEMVEPDEPSKWAVLVVDELNASMCVTEPGTVEDEEPGDAVGMKFDKAILPLFGFLPPVFSPAAAFSAVPMLISCGGCALSSPELTADWSRLVGVD